MLLSLHRPEACATKDRDAAPFTRRFTRVTDSRTLTARWVFPVSGPPLDRGTVTIRGDKIEAVEPRGTRTPDEDLGNFAIIPGLVNTHTHLDLSGARGLIPTTDPDHFTDWLRGVIAYRRSRTPEQVQADIRAGLAECLQSGTTLVGDITADGGSWDALAEAKARAVVFREVIGLSFDWQDVYFNANAWLGSRENTPGCRRALSPHAPYTVRAILFTVAAERCLKGGLPSAIHLAESPAEVELVTHRTGDFAQFLAEFRFHELDKLVGAFTDLVVVRETNVPQSVHPLQLPVRGNMLPAEPVHRLLPPHARGVRAPVAPLS